MSDISSQQLRDTIEDIISHGNPAELTTKQIRQQVELTLNLDTNSLLERKDEINQIIANVLRDLEQQKQQNNKKLKTESSTTATNSSYNDNNNDISVGDNQPNEEFYIDLGQNKRVSVSEYNKKLLINIREYYQDKASNEMKPGKKGIALNESQFQKLVDNINKIKYQIKQQS